MIFVDRIKDRLLNIIKNKFFGKMYLGKRLSKTVWEQQFTSGYWDYLYSDDEKGHYLTICELYKRFKPGGKILDVGCGQGVLYYYISENVKSDVDYFGLDISLEAVKIAQQRFGSEKFMQLDFDRAKVKNKYDVIIFNETLYYFEQPIQIIEQSIFLNLNSNGYFIVSMFDLHANTKIWEELHNNYKFLETKTVMNSKGQKWRVCIFMP